PEVLHAVRGCEGEPQQPVRCPESIGMTVISRILVAAVSLLTSLIWVDLQAHAFADPLPPISYPDPTDLSYFRDRDRAKPPIRTRDDWEVRRRHVLENVQRVMGPLPGRRVLLDVKLVEEKRVGELIRRKLTYQSDADDRVPAYLFLPAVRPAGKLPA